MSVILERPNCKFCHAPADHQCQCGSFFCTRHDEEHHAEFQDTLDAFLHTCKVWDETASGFL